MDKTACCYVAATLKLGLYISFVLRIIGCFSMTSHCTMIHVYVKTSKMIFSIKFACISQI